MKKALTILTLFFLVRILVFSQNLELLEVKLDSLAKKEKEIRAMIISYQDTLNQLLSQVISLENSKPAAQKLDYEEAIRKLIKPKTSIKTSIYAAVYEKPENNALTTFGIPANTRISILDISSFPFYKINYKNKEGYIHASTFIISSDVEKIEESLSKLASGNTKSGMTPPSSHFNNNTSSNYQYNTLTPNSSVSKSSNSGNCSSTQCTGFTKKGTRCKNRTTNCSGRCYQH